MLSIHKPDVVLLQETLGSEADVTTLLSSISPLYTFIAQSARGHFGGLAIGWNQSTIRCSNSWGAPSGLGVQISWAEANLNLNIVNIYGPYNNRVEFWDSFKNSDISRKENLIIGGDLNFTLGANKIWGPKVRTDPLALFFSNLLQNMNLIDLDPQKSKLSWTNRRVGEDRITKRLDRFLLVENILDENLMFK